jgi:hypothetical protein
MRRDAMSQSDRPAVGTNVWQCYPNFIACQRGDHLWAHYKAGVRVDFRGMQGPLLIECRQCDPPQYYLAVFSMSQRTHVTCYELSKASYDEFNTRFEDALPEIPELLYRLRAPDGRSYNPNWRPPR